jgi:hypothetical protein
LSLQRDIMEGVASIGRAGQSDRRGKRELDDRIGDSVGADRGWDRSRKLVSCNA